MATLKPRLINAIRCLAASKKPIGAKFYGADFNQVFPTELCSQNIAERVFLKLRELEFRLMGFTEMHLYFYPDKDSGVKQVLSDGVHLWKRDVYVAMDPALWLTLDVVEQESQLIEVMLNACRFVSSDDCIRKVDTAELALLEQRAELCIKVFEKNIQSYCVTIFCQVPSGKEPVVSQILYRDKKVDRSYQTAFVDTNYVLELIHLCGLVTVKSGEITVLPRKGHFASSVSWKYGAPKRFQISDMKSVD